MTVLSNVISYLKPYNCVQTNVYYLIEIITWKHKIVYKLSVLDKNTWKQKNYV